jgi:acetoacetate decarboxylase
MISKNQLLEQGFSLPFSNPTYCKGPYRFINREYLIITYETEMEALQEVVPEPLKIEKPYVKYEFIKMPDSSGFGSYTESGQVIEVSYQGKKGDFVHSMYLDSEKPIAAGREIWGFPKTLGYPSLRVDVDVVIGELFYQEALVARATMGFKEEKVDCKLLEHAMQNTNNYLLKIIPHVDGSLRICELVSYRLENIHVKEAWQGKGALELWAHALAPVAQLPIKKVVSSLHFVADLTLPYGKVVCNYLEK